MMRAGNVLFAATILAAVFLAALYSPSFAQPVIVGERVEFSPANPLPGSQVTVRVHFRVEGEAANYFISPVITTVPPSPPGPPPPVIALGRLEPGRHSHQIIYTIPAPPPSKICFDFGPVNGACLESAMKVASDGTGQRIVVAQPAQPAPGGAVEKPDLIVRVYYGRIKKPVIPLPVINLLLQWQKKYVDKITVQNIGRGTANNVSAHLECLVGDAWLPAGTTFNVRGRGRPGELLPGEEVAVSFSGPTGKIPTGTTKIRFVVDPGNYNDETNEANNIVEIGR